MSQDPRDKPPAGGSHKTIMGYAPPGGGLPQPWGTQGHPPQAQPEALRAPEAQPVPAPFAPMPTFNPPPPQQPQPQAQHQAQHQAQPQAQPPFQAAPAPHAAAPMILPLHAGARGAYLVVGILLTILIIAIPFAIWAFVVRARGRIEVHGSSITAYGFFTRRWDLRAARRLGVLRVPIYARGIGGALARRKVGGDHGVHLCMIDDRGKKATLLVSMYENHGAIIQHAAASTGLPLEDVQVGALGPKWPGT